MSSRRNFLKSSGSAMGASWLVLNAPLILTACRTAQTNSAIQASYVNISSADAVELEAIVDQIIPPDETPGATETGVVYFIDAALGGFMADATGSLEQGLGELAAKAQLKGSQAKGNQDSKFSDLSFDQQTSLLKEIEDTQFFGTVHFLTMMGMFCLPQYAGNRDNIGWDLLGFDHQHVWQAPFGYYDAALHERTAGKGDDHGHS
jgi:gluconate 2-dehydrogenase gamma chain